MTQSPYAPPKAEVADVQPQRPASWGRVVWLQPPIFVGLLALGFVARETLVPGLMGWGIAVGLVITIVLLQSPIKAMRSLSEAAPSWWWDALYYSSVVLFIGGLVTADPNLMVAGAAPTVVLNGVIGVLAFVTERRRNVRVHISGRRYLFFADRAL